MSLPRTELVQLLQQNRQTLKDKVDKFAEIHEKAHRVMLENETAKRVTKKDVNNAKLFALQPVIKDILELADNLGRGEISVSADIKAFIAGKATPEQIAAIEASEPKRQLSSLFSAICKTESDLQKLLNKYHTIKHDPLGVEFNPHFHNAMFELDHPTFSPGTVAYVVKHGYVMHDRVIRPASVGVVRNR